MSPVVSEKSKSENTVREPPPHKNRFHSSPRALKGVRTQSHRGRAMTLSSIFSARVDPTTAKYITYMCMAAPALAFGLKMLKSATE